VPFSPGVGKGREVEGRAREGKGREKWRRGEGEGFAEPMLNCLLLAS